MSKETIRDYTIRRSFKIRDNDCFYTNTVKQLHGEDNILIYESTGISRSKANKNDPVEMLFNTIYNSIPNKPSLQVDNHKDSLAAYERLELESEVIKTAANIAKTYGLAGIDFFIKHFSVTANEYVDSVRKSGSYPVDLYIRETNNP